MDAAGYVVALNGQQPFTSGALHTLCADKGSRFSTSLGESISVCCGIDCATPAENTGHHSVTVELHPLTTDFE